MRIKKGEYIVEVNKVQIRETDICIDTKFYNTGEDTIRLGKQLLVEGYADLTPYVRSIFGN